MSADAVSAVRRSEPRPALGTLKHLALGAFWLGTYFVIVPVYTILLPVQVGRFVRPENQGAAIGLATGIGGLLATVIPPLVGHYSDRLRTRWGRRKPVILVGAIGSAAALLALRSSHGYLAVMASFVAVVALMNTAGAAYVALIPDTVARHETGKASGLWGAFLQAGGALALMLVFFLATGRMLGQVYFLLAAALLLTLIPSFWAIGARDESRRARNRRIALRRFLAPLWSGDFGWAFLTRLLTTAGFFSILPFLLLIFRQFESVSHPVRFTALFELAVTGIAIPVSILCGWLSDRHGRKRFVYASGALAFAVLLVMLTTSRVPTPFLVALGLVYGLSYGAFSAVDWALALDTLPDRDNPAKDLGLFHVADALPRVVIPVVAGAVLDTFNQVQPGFGFRAVFALAIVFYVFGTVFVSRIRSVA
jgi:MFS family permease